MGIIVKFYELYQQMLMASNANGEALPADKVPPCGEAASCDETPLCDEVPRGRSTSSSRSGIRKRDSTPVLEARCDVDPSLLEYVPEEAPPADEVVPCGEAPSCDEAPPCDEAPRGRSTSSSRGGIRRRGSTQ